MIGLSPALGNVEKSSVYGGGEIKSITTLFHSEAFRHGPFPQQNSNFSKQICDRSLLPATSIDVACPT